MRTVHKPADCGLEAPMYAVYSCVTLEVSFDGQHRSRPSRWWSVTQTKRGMGWVSQGSEDNKIRVSVCPEWGAIFDALTEWRSLVATPGILLAKASRFLWNLATLAEEPLLQGFSLHEPRHSLASALPAAPIVLPLVKY